MGTFPRVTHPSATDPEGPVRLACVRPAASVRSEPGSNSQVEEFNLDIISNVLTESSQSTGVSTRDVSSKTQRQSRCLSRLACRHTRPQGHRRLRFSLSVSTCQRAKRDNTTIPTSKSQIKDAVVSKEEAAAPSGPLPQKRTPEPR